MSNALPKWNEERTAQLIAEVGSESPVSQATVVRVAEVLETSARSISSKLRKLGVDVALATAAPAKYTEAQEEALAQLVVSNSGQYTYGDIAAAFEGGSFSPKSIQGKILSMELTEHVKATPKVEVARTYTDAEEAKFVKLASEGAFIEQIAKALGKEVNSVRGKALSLLRNGQITAIPKQEHSAAASKTDELDALGDVSGMTVEAIATALEKTPRGVKTMLTRRGIKVADYDGAAKKEKAAASAE